MQESRLFKIVYHLLNKGHATAPELAKKLEVSVRTIYRDIEALSEAGIPIYTETGRSGGIHLMSDFVLGKVMLSEREKKELLAALQSLTATGNTYPDSLLEKLTALFSTPSESWFGVDFSRWGNETRDKQYFELLKTAILKKRCVKLHYASINAPFSERTVQPVKLLYKSRAWYLHAFCMERQAYRFFRLSRILDCELLDEGIEPASLPEYQETSTQEYQKFVFLFSKEVTYRVYDEFNPDLVQRQENGDLLVTVWLPYDEWIIGFLLSVGHHVEIIEPPDLKEVIAERAKKIYEKNKY
ncbi:MAG: YafY family transcriptional regulator [Lachnospiraceae bacterium]|nr:YafY family transcriptional regulator [Lachnospiraceae bacterium]